jgi:glycosyltransferase involved in cell wall biosynthesis
MAAEPSKLSVIIPCFNHGEFLPDAVASVKAARRDDVQLIVVDDGSTDERTRHELDSLEASGIHVIHQKNKGLAGARNAGITASHGKYILPLDADNRIRPAYIDRGIQILDANAKIGVVYGDAERVTYDGAKDPLRPLGHWRPGPFDKLRLLEWNFIDACAVYRRAVWEQNRGYDASMPLPGLEDWDFWLGALEHGWHFHYIPEILFDYRVSGDSMITRTYGSESAISEFVGHKHGPLYREAWLQAQEEMKSLKSQLESGTATLRNLRRIAKSRIKKKLGGSRAPGAKDAAR